MSITRYSKTLIIKRRSIFQSEENTRIYLRTIQRFTILERDIDKIWDIAETKISKGRPQFQDFVVGWLSAKYFPFDENHSTPIRNIYGVSHSMHVSTGALSLSSNEYIERTFGGLMHQGKIDRLPTGRDLTRSIWNALFTRFKIKPSLSLLVFIFSSFPPLSFLLFPFQNWPR